MNKNKIMGGASLPFGEGGVTNDKSNILPKQGQHFR